MDMLLFILWSLGCFLFGSGLTLIWLIGKQEDDF